MKSSFVVISTVLLWAGLIATARDHNPTVPVLNLSDYELVFSDEFEELSISAGGPGTTWTAHTPWGGDFGDAQFADPGPDGPFKVEDGKLMIEARKRRDGTWQSGLIASIDKAGNGFTLLYGYVEMRAKLPAGKGLWSAFWLNANQPHGSKESGLEIDVLEHYGHFPEAYQSVIHIWPKPEVSYESPCNKVIKVEPGTLYSEFHTYGVEVDPQWITIYLDRVPQSRCPTPREHRTQLMILANLAMGSGWPIDESPSPSVMEIDYIKAYRKLH